ncbi:MAG: YihY/virulence factor BrkB family protein [Spirochaetaceae bacterium]
MSPITERLLGFPPFKRLTRVARRMILPGFRGLSVYDVGRFFVMGLVNGAITTRAASIAYRFILSFFPAMLFLVTVIPHVPLPGFQEHVFLLITGAFPQELAVFVEHTIRDVVTRPRPGLLSVTLLFSLYMATRGVLGIIRSFHASYHDFDTHPKPLQWLVSMGLVGLLGSLLLGASVLQIGGGVVLSRLAELGLLPGSGLRLLLTVARLLLVALMLLIAVSSLFYWAPGKEARPAFVSPGSLVSTIAILLVNAAFNIYLSNVSQWNVLFGSLGTIIVLLIWIYAVSLVLVIGFELNVSIGEAENDVGAEGN